MPGQPSAKAVPAALDAPRPCFRTGFRVDSRSVVTLWAQWSDVDTAAGALTAAGPSWSATENVGTQKFDEELRTALAPFQVDGIGYDHPSEFG